MNWKIDIPRSKINGHKCIDLYIYIYRDGTWDMDMQYIH